MKKKAKLASRSTEMDWKKVALEALDALRTFNAYYDDLAKSNPGFMGKLCLQDYAQWNEAMLKSEIIQRKYPHLMAVPKVRKTTQTP